MKIHIIPKELRIQIKDVTIVSIYHQEIQHLSVHLFVHISSRELYFMLIAERVKLVRGKIEFILRSK